MSKKKTVSQEAAKIALDAATEINELRERIVVLTGHSMALNEVCWSLSTALGLVKPGQTQIEMAPMELVRLVLARGQKVKKSDA